MASPFKNLFTGYIDFGHPGACTAGNAVLEILERDGLVANMKADGVWLRQQTQALRRSPSVGDIRDLGLMIGIEFVADQASRQCWDAGLVIRAETGTIDGVDGEHMLFAPQLTATRAELSEILAILDGAIARAEVQGGSAAS